MTQQTARIIEPTSATWVLDNTTSVRVDGRRETVVIQHDGALDTDQARWLATTLERTRRSFVTTAAAVSSQDDSMASMSEPRAATIDVSATSPDSARIGTPHVRYHGKV